jgi:hypothetical protein
LLGRRGHAAHSVTTGIRVSVDAMDDDRPTRVLVVTDHTAATDEVLSAVRERATRGKVQFRVLVPNPARAEAHLLHSERHIKAEEAEKLLAAALPLIAEAAGGPVLGSVSIRHDPYDAIEETMRNEPVEEIILSVSPHELSRRLHLDLPHRLAHFGIPLTTVGLPLS